MAEPKRVLIIVAPYYEHISTMLIEGATAALEAAECEVHIREVPGALEIPIAIRIALEANAGLMTLGTDWGTPIGNGILTVENESQAIARANPKQKNKGADAASACIALMALRDEITGDDETSIGRDPTFLPDSEHFDVADANPMKSA